MEKILEKARELGQLIADSEEFQNMRALEEEAARDEELAERYAEYTELRERFSALQAEDEDKNQGQLRELAVKISQMEAQLNQQRKLAALNQARARFDRLMARVNRALQSRILGEEENPEGCGPGGCAGCTGCGPQR